MKKKWLKEIKIYKNKSLLIGIFKIIFIINWLPFLLYLFWLIIIRSETIIIRNHFMIFMLIYVVISVLFFSLFYLIIFVLNLKYAVIYEIKDNMLYIYNFNVTYNNKNASKFLDNDYIINEEYIDNKEEINLNNLSKIRFYNDKIYLYDNKLHVIYNDSIKVRKHLEKYLK